MKSEPLLTPDFARLIAESGFFQASQSALVSAATALAVLLLRCIALSTNLFYYHRSRHCTRFSGGQPAGLLDGGSASNRRPSGRVMARFVQTRFVGMEFPRPSRQSCFTARRWIPKSLY